MKKIFLFVLLLTTVTSLSAFAERSNANGIANANSNSIQGFAGSCYMFLANGSPTIRVSIYDEQEAARADDAQASAKLKESLLIDLGPGYQLLQIFPQSKALKICELLQKNQGEKKVSLSFNKEKVVTSLTVDHTTVQSDAYILMDAEKQRLVKALVSAYIHSENETYACQKLRSEKNSAISGEATEQSK